ncbi:MAG: hypothetical protein V7K69_00325 [Nostoc sp.]|uniref:hypothetical protein n=1 Tax=Nostoc sp. TaxID=1180 RepID=UPI002FFAA307
MTRGENLFHRPLWLWNAINRNAAWLFARSWSNHSTAWLMRHRLGFRPVLVDLMAGIDIKGDEAMIQALQLQLLLLVVFFDTNHWIFFLIWFI